VKGIDAMSCEILVTANARISHDGNAAAWFVGRGGGPVATAAVARRPIKGVVRTPLMSHLVSNVIDSEGISHRSAQASHSHSLFTTTAGNAKLGDAAPTRAEDMTYIIVGRTDHGIDVGLVLVQHGEAIAVCVRVRVWIGVNDQVVVRDEVHVNGDIPLVNAVDAIHDQDLSGLRSRHRAPTHGCGIFTRGS
jgi:hypothetical protein